jgi:DNA-binding XRE family transcriptional regulator
LFRSLKNTTVVMEIPSQAKDDFTTLAEELRRHGVDADIQLNDILVEDERRRLVQIYEDRPEDGREFLRDLLAREVRDRIVSDQKKAEELRQRAEREKEAISTWVNTVESDSPLGTSLSWNVTAARRTLDLTKSALARKASSTSRSTIIRVEQGDGARLQVVEAIAGAMQVPPELLLLTSTELGVLLEALQPTDPMQELLQGILDRQNDAATFVRHLTTDSRLKAETLQVVGDVLAIINDRYEGRAAQVGAAIGWTQGLPPRRRPSVTDGVTRGLIAAAVAGWWGHELADVGLCP